MCTTLHRVMLSSHLILTEQLMCDLLFVNNCILGMVCDVFSEILDLERCSSSVVTDDFSLYSDCLVVSCVSYCNCVYMHACVCLCVC